MSRSRPPLPTGAALTFVGALGVVIGCFLPAAEPRGYKLFVRDTTLVEMGDGLVFVAGAVGAAIVAYRVWTGVSTAHRAILVLGVLGVAGALIETQVMTFESLTLSGAPTGEVEQADPAVGVWVVGLGAVLVAVGGSMLRSFVQTTTAVVPELEIPAGWYPNPEDASQVRWWDGERWTGATKDTGSEAAPPRT